MAEFKKEIVDISSSALHCWICMEQRAKKLMPLDYQTKWNLTYNEQLIYETTKKHAIQHPSLETIYENPNDAEEKTQFPKTPSILCPGCKMQRYCCLNHLKCDRSEHRELCEVFTDLQKKLRLAHPLLILKREGIFCILQLQRSIGLLKYIAHVKMGRHLTSREEDLIGHPAYCQICFKLEDLRACGGCGAVAYCSDVHGQMDTNKHTPGICRTLALVYSPYRQPRDDNVKFTDLPIDITADQVPLILERSHLIEAVEEFTGLAVNDSPWKTFQDYQNFDTCSSFSGIASICLALKNISYTPKPQKFCTIYVVDPSYEQIHRYFQEMHFKFFFHMYSDLCKLDLYFVGDQLKLRRGVKNIEIITFEFQGLKRTIVKHICPMRFKQFASLVRIDPVLIIMFNIDLYGLYTIRGQIIEKMSHIRLYVGNKTEDYIKCLTEMMSIYRVPICFTSFTKALSLSNFMAFFELANQCSVEVKRCYRGDMIENPYREILPLRNQNPEIPETVIYANNYLEVVFTFPQE